MSPASEAEQSLLLMNTLMSKGDAVPWLHKEKAQSQTTNFPTYLFIFPVLTCILYNKPVIINITLFKFSVLL